VTHRQEVLPEGAGTPTTAEPSTGELVAQLSNTVSQLIREELRLANWRSEERRKEPAVELACSVSPDSSLPWHRGLGRYRDIGSWFDVARVARRPYRRPRTRDGRWRGRPVGQAQAGESAPPVPTRTIQNLKRDIETVRRPGLLRSRAPESPARLQEANHE
jgi:hypothetical protein